MVDQARFDKFLKERFDDQVGWYDRKSMNNQTWAKRYQVTVIILSAITPVFAALQYKWPTIISAAFVSAMVGILKYYKYEEHWHNYRTTCETLKKEKILFDAKLSPYDKADEPMGLFIERAESLISKENTSWVQIVSKKKEKD